MIFRVDWCADWISYCGDWTYKDSVCVNKDGKEDGMDTPGFASPIRVYSESRQQMRKSNDISDTEPTYLDSLGVMDLDISLCSDAFGLRAFDEKMPLTRMLPGSGPCDLRLLIPDAGLGKAGFHDVVIENLLGTSVWRSKHVTPADVIGLRQRWPRAVFHIMRERCVELEDLRRKAYRGDQSAYRYTGRGFCPICETKTDYALDSHMMCNHLDLGQLWRCPVKWCAVWKGSVRECRDHFNEKHSGSETIDLDKVSKAFPTWTVTQEFWNRHSSLNHPRFLEWLGAPDSAWLLEMSPGHWCDTLSRDQAMTAAMQLHRDACLMQTNLDILDQYALALHGTASKLLQSTIGGGPYPGAEVASAAPGAHARRASVQMEALGLWRPSMDPLQFAATRS